MGVYRLSRRELPPRQVGGEGFMTLQAFSERLQAFRTAQGMNVTELARALQVSRETVWRWETGNAMPSYQNLVKLQKLGFPT